MGTDPGEVRNLPARTLDDQCKHLLPGREARFEFRGQTEVAIECRHDRNPRMLSGRLLDLTLSGAKLETQTPLPLEESVTLYFRFGQMNLNFMVEAQVRWTRPAKDPYWWMGCAFSPKLPEEHLANLAGEGMLNRRREPRRKVCLAAMARWELAAEQEVAVRIDDFSLGGVRMLSPQPALPGQRLLLHAAGVEGQRLVDRLAAIGRSSRRKGIWWVAALLRPAASRG